MNTFNQVLQEVDQRCRERHIPMIGPEKAAFLADCVQKAQPNLVVECGTAIGYSGLWIANALGNGRLITVEIKEESALDAQESFRRVGVIDLIDSRIGDAAEVLKTIREPVDFLLIDNSQINYFASFRAIESQLTDGATIITDNVAMGTEKIEDYLDHIRSRYESQTHWFDTDLPWVSRDAMERTVYRR